MQSTTGPARRAKQLLAQGVSPGLATPTLPVPLCRRPERSRHAKRQERCPSLTRPSPKGNFRIQNKSWFEGEGIRKSITVGMMRIDAGGSSGLSPEKFSSYRRGYNTNPDGLGGRWNPGFASKRRTRNQGHPTLWLRQPGPPAVIIVPNP